MTTDDLTTARLDVPAAVVEAQIARDVPASEVRPVVDELHDRLMAGPLDGEHLVQVHEFLDIDADIKDRPYPPMPWARKAIPGLYPDTSSPTNFTASAGYREPIEWGEPPVRRRPAGYSPDCEPTFPPPKPVTDAPVIGGGL